MKLYFPVSWEAELYRPGARNDENANAEITPGTEPSNRDTPLDSNVFHATHTHAHEGALRKTVEQMDATLKGELHECKGCLLAKGIRMPILSKTHGQAVYDLGGRGRL